MAERRWTVMLIPHGEGASRSVSISMTVVKLLAAVGTVAGAFVLAGTFGVVSRTVDIARSDRLERANQALASEIARMDARVNGLSDTLSVISRRDEQVRLVAGLRRSTRMCGAPASAARPGPGRSVTNCWSTRGRRDAKPSASISISMD